MQRTPLRRGPARHLFALALALAFAALAVAWPAHGYCRKTTNGPTDPTYDPARTGECGDGPNALPLYWATRCIEYRVTVDAALVSRDLMTPERGRAIVRKAIATWVTAMCGTKDDEGHPAIWLVDVFDTRCPGATGRTRNEVQFLASAPTFGELALTEVTMRRNTGQVDAAVTHVYVYDVLSSFGRTPAEIDPRAELVVRHELGHFLGLAHSQERSAVMFARYENASVGLSGDDARAICDAYDPAAGAPPEGCRASSAHPRKSHGGGLALALAAVLVAFARRRRVARDDDVVTKVTCGMHHIRQRSARSRTFSPSGARSAFGTISAERQRSERAEPKRPLANLERILRCVRCLARLVSRAVSPAPARSASRPSFHWRSPRSPTRVHRPPPPTT